MGPSSLTLLLSTTKNSKSSSLLWEQVSFFFFLVSVSSIIISSGFLRAIITPYFLSDTPLCSFFIEILRFQSLQQRQQQQSSKRDSFPQSEGELLYPLCSYVTSRKEWTEPSVPSRTQGLQSCLPLYWKLLPPRPQGSPVNCFSFLFYL